MGLMQAHALHTVCWRCLLAEWWSSKWWSSRPYLAGAGSPPQLHGASKYSFLNGHLDIGRGLVDGGVWNYSAMIQTRLL
eukprot:m.146131 g.146131  ORF g.146131 m.146131 type:complete len:79 (+) comp23093_c0_seq1:926-1162(+)